MALTIVLGLSVVAVVLLGLTLNDVVTELREIKEVAKALTESVTELRNKVADMTGREEE